MTISAKMFTTFCATEKHCYYNYKKDGTSCITHFKNLFYFRKTFKIRDSQKNLLLDSNLHRKRLKRTT